MTTTLPLEFDRQLVNGNVKAAMNAAGAKSSDLWKVPRASIIVMPGFNVRDPEDEGTKAHIRGIADSIKADGFYDDKPLVGFVAKNDEGKEEICLTDGHCRLAAFDLAVAEGYEGTTLPVVIKPRGTNLEDLTVALVTGNTGKPLTPLEVAVACKRLQSLGLDDTTIAKRLNFKTVSYVAELLDLIGSPREVRDMVRSGKVSATEARKALKQHGTKTAAVLADAVKIAANAGKTRATAKHINQASPPNPEKTLRSYDLVKHLQRQMEFSASTFGPGARTQGVVDHIRKELIEVLEQPDSPAEWIDIILLALDGAWRTGASAEQVAQALRDKQTCNESRTWPDWRECDPDKAIEHERCETTVETPDTWPFPSNPLKP
ncbi:dATP/dGTP pyrophosphohydrolase domain-containing protein [Achromobacter pestifer]